MRAPANRTARPAEPLPSRRRAQLALFARNFFKHPRMLGSIIPSSPWLVRRLLQRVDGQRARVIVEYGPGVGTITRELLRHMHPDSTLVVLETNEDFVEFLRQSLPDPRLKVIHGSAESGRAALSQLGLPAADHVLSGIPFTTMTPDEGDRILEASRDILSPEGSMLVYQFSTTVLPGLRRVFSDVELDFELLNFLPARLFYCRP